MEEEKITRILDILEEEYPEAECALHHKNIFELLISVILSAQTTDVSVNKVTPALFRAYPDAEALASADPDKISSYIKSIGMYRTKSKHIVAAAKKLVDDFGGEVPEDLNALMSLPGVGRKTANVVLSVGFGHQRIAVDTHVFRVANRIGLVHAINVMDTERELMKRIPESRWSRTHHSLIFHGRNRCRARKPDCENCPIGELCEKNIG